MAVRSTAWSAAVRLVGLRVRIPWMSISCVCCVLSGSGLCVGPNNHQTSPAEGCMSECDLETSKLRRPRPTRAVEP